MSSRAAVGAEGQSRRWAVQSGSRTSPTVACVSMLVTAVVSLLSSRRARVARACALHELRIIFPKRRLSALEAATEPRRSMERSSRSSLRRLASRSRRRSPASIAARTAQPGSTSWRAVGEAARRGERVDVREGRVEAVVGVPQPDASACPGVSMSSAPPGSWNSSRAGGRVAAAASRPRGPRGRAGAPSPRSALVMVDLPTPDEPEQDDRPSRPQLGVERRRARRRVRALDDQDGRAPAITVRPRRRVPARSSHRSALLSSMTGSAPLAQASAR